jgi:predicted Zn-ribbon and HTH transcriptional regulator
MKVNEGYEGEGLPFFRCMLCGGVLSVWDLEKHHGCPKCASKKIKNTALSFWEQVSGSSAGR